MKYRRLPGKKRSFGHWRTLWMGEDHLLAVDSNGYSEDYTRYYYKDIKAVMVRRTARGRIWNAILATALGVCLFSLVWYVFYRSEALAVLVVFGTPLFLAGLLVNTLRGPTCRCHILMPLGIRELPTLKRIKTVRKTLDRLRPCIEERQGTIAQEVAAARSGPPAIEPLPFSTGHSTGSFVPVLPEVTPEPMSVAAGNNGVSDYRGSAHYAAFSLLIAQAFLGVTALEYHGTPYFMLYGLLMLGLFVCLMTAVVKQHFRTVPRLAGRLVWAALLGMTCVILLGYYVGVFLRVMETKGKANPGMDVPGIVSAITIHPFFPYCIVCFSVCSAVIGVLGLLSCLRGTSFVGAAGWKSGRSLPRDVVQ
jgi:hypothetical protein